VRDGRKIIKHFRPDATRESLRLGNDVTFKEFVQFLLTPGLSKHDYVRQGYNEHWELFDELCHPCLIKYNTIAKYESINEDSDFVLRKIGANLTFPRSNKAGGTKKRLTKAFSEIPSEMIEQLYKLYQKDFEIFDYKISDVL
jgi:chondroitin 4-sulfotransferase 11